MPSLRVIFAIILSVFLATQIGTLLTFQLQRDGYVKDANLIRSTFDTGEKTTSSLNSRDVIVYLAQFGNHSTYGSPAFTKLNKSIDLLYTNYLNDFPCSTTLPMHQIPPSYPAWQRTAPTCNSENSLANGGNYPTVSKRPITNDGERLGIALDIDI